MPMDILDLARPIDEAAIQRWRLQRVRSMAGAADAAGVLLFDPINIRYANGSRNMQVWTMHNFCRYALILTDGPSIQFELPACRHLLEGLETIDEVRDAWSTDYAVTGCRMPEIAQKWACEIAGLAGIHAGDNRRIAVDRCDAETSAALIREGLLLVDGKKVMEHARSVKSLEEIRAFKYSLTACEAAMQDLREQLQPEMTEQEALSVLLAGSIKRGGEYPETRLMTSGPRANPWFQETSDRVMKKGDLLSFDTDLVGPMGFYNDISRSWIVGDSRPTPAQQQLYRIALEQLQTNIELLEPGLSYFEFASKAYQLPSQYLANRYADVGHGCGLGVEYPFLWYPEDHEFGACDGIFEENMIVCIESYIGAMDGYEGVKLEQPVWIRPDGPAVLSDFPLEENLR